jgi:predicted nucleic acid-binding Zn ribbon protein
MNFTNDPFERTMDRRELTRGERAVIRKLVVYDCANFDREYGCLPQDGECYMLYKWWMGAYCKYFQSAVLPLDPVLATSLTGGVVPVYKPCAVCGGSFIVCGRQIYCSPTCQSDGNRRRSRARMRNKRQKKFGRDVTI